MRAAVAKLFARRIGCPISTSEPKPPRAGRWQKKAGLVLLALLLLAGVALLVVNWVANSSGFRERVAAATKNRLGFPVRFERATFTPWGGMTLSGFLLSSSEEESGEAGEKEEAEGGSGSLEIASIEARPVLLSLLGEAPRFSQVTVGAPKLTAFRSRDGQVHLPIVLVQASVQAMTMDRATLEAEAAAAHAESNAGAAGAAAQAAPTEASATATGAGAGDGTPLAPAGPSSQAAPKESATVKAPEPTAPVQPGLLLGKSGKRLLVDRIGVEEGDLIFEAEGLSAPVLEILGCRLELKTLGPEPSGTATIREVRVLGSRVGSDIRARVVVRDGFQVFLEELEGTVFEGRLEGGAALNPTGAGRPFQISLQGIDGRPAALSGPILEVAKALGLTSVPKIDNGRLDWQIQGSGFAAFPDSVQLQMAGRSTDFVVEGMGGLLPNSQSAGANGAAMRRLEVPLADFSAALSHGSIHLADARLKTEHGVVRGVALLRPDRTLVGRAALYLSDEVAGFVARIRRESLANGLFQPFEGTTWLHREMRLGGSLSAPQIDLWEPGKFLTLSDTIARIEADSRRASGTTRPE